VRLCYYIIGLSLINFLFVSIADSTDDTSVVHVSQISEMVSVGDVILFKCGHMNGKLQRGLTGSKWDHVGIVVRSAGAPGFQLLEASAEGVHLWPLKQRLHAYSLELAERIAIRRLLGHRTEEMLDSLNAFVDSVEGKPYELSAIKLLKVSSRVVSKKSKEEAPPSSLASSEAERKGFFCSELTVAALKAMGIVKAELNAVSMWPVNLASGGELDKYLNPGYELMPEVMINCEFVAVGTARSKGFSSL
jgi:hypothetical protein